MIPDPGGWFPRIPKIPYLEQTLRPDLWPGFSPRSPGVFLLPASALTSPQNLILRIHQVAEKVKAIKNKPTFFGCFIEIEENQNTENHKKQR